MKARNSMKHFKDFKWYEKNRKKSLISRGETYVSRIATNALVHGWKWLILSLGEPIALRDILIGIVLAFLSQHFGTHAITTYATMIFKKSGTNFSTEWSSIVMAMVRIAGTLLAARFVETQGRKTLLLVSLTGCTFGITAMTIHIYCVSWGHDMSMFTWVPATSFGFVTLISSVGIDPLPMICLVEWNCYHWTFDRLDSPLELVRCLSLHSVS